MECPWCHSALAFREVAGRRCPSCNVRIYLSDQRWKWLRVLSSVGLAAVLTCHWFPRSPDLVWFFLWLLGLLVIAFVLLMGSMFVLRPDIDLVPPHGPISLDI
jgi:hypothetical protein